jgi:N-acetylneuraminic acid mutarotase
MPEARQETGIVALGNSIYVISGYGSDTVPSPLVQVYDAAGKQWKNAVPIPEPLHHPGVAALDGKIYVVGGFAGSFAKRNPLDSVWQYDPTADRWERRATLPTKRGALAAAALDGRIYALGGERFAAAGGGQAYEPVADAAVYDPKTNAWEVLPPMRYRRDHLVAGAIGGRLYAVAGRDRPNYILKIVEEYDPKTRAWSERAPMPSGRSGAAAAVVNNRLYVFGGEGNADNPLGTFNQVEAYDPARDAWTQLAPMPLPRHAFGAAVVGNRIYLPGGSIVQGGRAPGTTPIVDTFEPN